MNPPAEVLLAGDATAPGFRKTGRYIGTTDATGIFLRGQQSWMHYMDGRQFSWPCEGDFKRAGVPYAAPDVVAERASQ